MEIPTRYRHILPAMVLAILMQGAAGCTFFSMLQNPDSTLVSSPATAGPMQMPGVTNTDLDATGRKLIAAGMKVLVKRPKITVNPGETDKEASFDLPEIMQPFKPAKWNHLIAGQDPAPGVPLQPGSTVTLTAGLHHGAGPFRPWLEAHGGSVKHRGDLRCGDCHTRQYCTECHHRI